MNLRRNLVVWFVTVIAVALAAGQPAANPELTAADAELQAANAERLRIWRAMAPGQTVDWNALIATALEAAEKKPDSPQSAELATMVMYRYEGEHSPAKSAAMWRRLEGSPNAELAKLARNKVASFAALSAPLELAFTTPDGRDIDLGKLRGKVVLIDFWATWCRPCMAEMPNVRKIYGAYRDRGFEIIGVSCDFTAENAGKYPTSAARTGAQVVEFCRQNDMPWPQHYEGRKHQGCFICSRRALRCKTVSNRD